MKTSEMIAMLEDNPNMSFSRKSRDRTFFVGVRSGYFVEWAIGTNGETIKHSLPGGLKFFGNTSTNADWQLVRESVPVWEAIKAYTEGKTVTCDYTSEKYGCDKTFVINRREPGLHMSVLLLVNGRWYIEEGQS